MIPCEPEGETRWGIFGGMGAAALLALMFVRGSIPALSVHPTYFELAYKRDQSTHRLKTRRCAAVGASSHQ